MTTKPVLDNRKSGGKAGDFLREALTPNAEVRAVSAYFSVDAFFALRDELNAVKKFHFLFGAPASAAVKNPDDADKPFKIGEDGDIALNIGEDGDITPDDALKQKPAAKACMEWINKESVHVKTLKSGFLHGKMYLADTPNGNSAGFCGSSNFTSHGLGFFANGGNWELNITADEKTRNALRQWFDNLWNDKDQVRDAKEEVLEVLRQLGENQTPEFIYYLTLYRLFKDELEAARKQESELHLEDSQIWNMLYRFQKDAVGGVIRRLERHRVCILADSVGLGKTYTALAALKYYENKHKSTLVLCPKRLEQNWLQFREKRKNNILLEDNLRYDISTHTKLGRNGAIAWGSYDLIVIDESHYFRNNKGARYKELQEALKGAKTKILMLSATPINTSLKDLRNQIRLGAEDDAFARGINIPSVEKLATAAQRAFAEWTKNDNQDKDALAESLGGNFLKLMEEVTVARPRLLIKKHYPEEDGKRLDFPAHDTIQNESPPTDTKGELVYADLHERISNFRLSIYSPSEFLRKEEKEKGIFLQTDREHFLIGMMCVNFLKRLESSPQAFRKTLERTITKIADTEGKIARYQKKEAIIRQQQPLADIGDAPPPPLDNRADTSDNTPEEADMEDEEDEDWTVGKKKIYQFSQLLLPEWLEHLQKDRKTLEELLAIAKSVVPKRDAKLTKLKELLRDKITNPTTNKDGGKNRKALLFTSFSDTARYLFEQLKPMAEELNIAIALVVGSGDNDTTTKDKNKQYGDILHRFSPGGQKPEGEEIDILIATDCVSEGQNLQDCDYVINYDIHWNPVRIVQRFGRIDRIGSKAERIKMTNFWPNIDLNEYLNLKRRVEARMALVELGGGGAAIDDENAEKTRILEFRDKQLLALYNKDIDTDSIDADGVAISDLTTTHFITELLAYIRKDEEMFKRAPNGLCAVVPANPKEGAHAGAIFCLNHKNAPKDNSEQRKQNRLHPHYLVYVREDEGGQVVYSHTSAARSLRLFGKLCRNEKKEITNLCNAFDSDIQSAQGKEKYNNMVQAAVRDIVVKCKATTLVDLSKDSGAKLPKKGDYPSEAKDFVLTSWLVIRDSR